MTGPAWLLWSTAQGSFWMPNREGVTSMIGLAGRFNAVEAGLIEGRDGRLALDGDVALLAPESLVVFEDLIVKDLGSRLKEEVEDALDDLASDLEIAGASLVTPQGIRTFLRNEVAPIVTEAVDAAVEKEDAGAHSGPGLSHLDAMESELAALFPAHAQH